MNLIHFNRNRLFVCFLATIFLFLQDQIYGQIITTQRVVVPVISSQKFYLNGGFRASMGGVSRQRIKVILPENTVEWCYAVTVSPNTNPNIDLSGQITNLLDPSGLTSTLIQQIMVPAGAGMCSTYLLDEANSNAFLQKADNNGGNFNHWPEAARENFTDGVVVIKSHGLQKGPFYLGVKNPSTSTGMYISLEVSAIVEEQSQTDVWSKEQKEAFFESYLNAINGLEEYKSKPDYAKQSIAACITKELTKTPPSKYFGLAEFEQQELSAKAVEKCLK